MRVLALSKAPEGGSHPEVFIRFVVLLCTLLGITVNRQRVSHLSKLYHFLKSNARLLHKNGISQDQFYF